MISWDEFSKLLTDPSLKMWMSAMDLDIADIKGLWNLLDDGKGHIVVDDFIQGAARVKGPAKGFDMAQVLLNSKRIEKKSISSVLKSPHHHYAIGRCHSLTHYHKI